MSYTPNLQKLSVNSTGKVASAVQADSATTATTATSATTAVTATTATTATTVADGSITTAKLANGAVTGIKRTNTVLGRTVITNGNKTNGTQFSVSAVCAGNPVKICFEPRPGNYNIVGTSQITSNTPNGQGNGLAWFLVYRNGTLIGQLGTLGFNFPNVTSGTRTIASEPGSFEFIDQSPTVATNTYVIELITASDSGEYYNFNAVDLVVREV